MLARSSSERAKQHLQPANEQGRPSELVFTKSVQRLSQSPQGGSTRLRSTLHGQQPKPIRATTACPTAPRSNNLQRYQNLNDPAASFSWCQTTAEANTHPKNLKVKAGPTAPSNPKKSAAELPNNVEIKPAKKSVSDPGPRAEAAAGLAFKKPGPYIKKEQPDTKLPMDMLSPTRFSRWPKRQQANVTTGTQTVHPDRWEQLEHSETMPVHD